MSPSTYNMYVDYAEFIEDVNNWEEIVEEMQ